MGTGKSRAACEKIHYACDTWPGVRVLIVRQTRHSLSSTVLVTYEDEVVPEGHPVLDGARRTHRDDYTYPNGSQIILGGMDKPLKFMSGQYDIIYFPEATEGREQDVDLVGSRLRNFKLPFQQFIFDCNPDVPNHWLKKRMGRGKTVELKSWFQDNPRYFVDGKPTAHGAAYLARLEDMTPHMKARLLDGIWAAPEGARFVGASRQRQGFSFYEKFPHGIPTSWKRWLSGDYGKADPYCCLRHAIDPYGDIWTYQENYRMGLEADEQAEDIVVSTDKNERYEAMYLDQSMWSKEKTFGGHPEKGPAADQYAKRFAAANKVWDATVFGPCVKGPQNVNEEGYVTLDSRLRDGTWHIAMECGNLWNEIENAVHYKDPRTGIMYEEVNPGGKKYCPDHALETSVYGIHKRTPKTPVKRDDTIDHEAARVAQLQEYRKNNERNRPTRPNYLR